MDANWFYPYPELLPGKLLKRYKRFLADIVLETGEIITAHCPNTGPMTGVCHPGNRVMVSRSTNPKRKLGYTWELIEVPSQRDPSQFVWTGVNTALPNLVMKSALEHHLFPALGTYTHIQSEVPYGAERKSRIDFLLTGTPDDRPIYLEVKNTTWARGSQAIFPDTVTTRGQKHLRELTNLLPQARSVMVYFINRGDCDEFSPGDEADPVYGKLLRKAIKTGVDILPCRFQIDPEQINYLGLAHVVLTQT
ncbi:MAG: DNA/RNA nuclease SfsA [Phormidesmis sp. RL_2_1]|nr:DNA/RNA nuclease SfsA [Phormidesmis sp. RL_2_1]